MKLINVYNKPDSIEWASLPNQFVLKLNVGSGGNIICHNKKELDIKDAKNKIEKYYKKQYHLGNAELQYKGVERKIIVEKYLGKNIIDYKFYCFRGIAKLVMVCLGRDKGKPKYYFYDEELKLVRINKDGQRASKDMEYLDKPIIKEAFKIASDLSKPFPFARTDLYIVDSTIYFGELTFTPAGGIDSNLTLEADLFLGNLLKLDLKGDKL